MWIEDMARVSYQELLRERLAILSEAVHART